MTGRLIRIVGAAAFGLAASAVGVTGPLAEHAAHIQKPAETVDAAAWQDVITQQIVALRSGDAPAAFSAAATVFRETFPDPYSFVLRIHQGGYAPIFESLSHRFGDFRQVDDTTVVQIVKLTGPNSKLYEALYRLGLEPEGWRVQAVVLRSGGMAV